MEDSGEIPLSNIFNYLLKAIEDKYNDIINKVDNLLNEKSLIKKDIRNVEEINKQLSLTMIELEARIKDNRNKINEIINIYSESQKLTGFVHISSIGNYTTIEKIIDKPGFLYYNLDINRFKESYIENNEIKFKIL